MTQTIYQTMRQIIASAQSAEGEVLEGVRRIDDVIDGVSNEAKQVCGEIFHDLHHLRQELQRLDQIAEQLEHITRI